MTTRLQIINTSDSSPGHVVEITHVAFGGQSQAVSHLAHGEVWERWLGSGEAVTCVERDAKQIGDGSDGATANS